MSLRSLDDLNDTLQGRGKGDRGKIGNGVRGKGVERKERRGERVEENLLLIVTMDYF